MSGFREAAADNVADVLMRLRSSAWQIAMVVTGGGAGAVSACFRRQGASANFVEAVIPYSRAALQCYLGGPPIQGSASVATATQAAMIAYERAVRLGTGDVDQAVGIALMAVLPTDPPRLDEHRVCVALKTAGGCESWTSTLGEGKHDRDSAELVADKMVFAAIEKLLTLPQD